jgi:EAL domain-containing protein (putative c-di-GMP-specific phosphodiesterase class I)
LNQGDENVEIVKTIVMLAGKLGMQVIAEGVETVDQLQQLRRLNCQYGQGYLFSKPLSANDADMLLLNERQLPQHNSISVGIDLTESSNVTFAM